MHYSHEIINYSNNPFINLFIHRPDFVPLHWHSSLEMLLILHGNLDIVISDQTYTLNEDDIILINKNELHEINSSDCIALALQIDISKISGSQNLNSINFVCNSAVFSNKSSFNKLKQLIAKILQINSSDSKFKELQTNSLVYELVYELTSNFKDTKGSKPTLLDNKNLEKLNYILNYIDEHYSEDLSLNKMAEVFSLSPPYFSQFFKSNMNMNFSDYLSNIRLSESISSLLSTDKSIEEISLEQGFSSSRSFVAAFKKKYNMLPSKYRSKFSNVTSDNAKISNNIYAVNSNYFLLGQHRYLDKLSEYLSLDDTENKNLPLNSSKNVYTIDLSKVTKKLKHTFKTFTSVGNARDILSRDIQDMLITLQSEIKFKYIKFHGILDDNMMLYNEDSNGNVVLNFFYIDKAIDFLLSINLKPLIELSFMPEKLAKNPSSTIFCTKSILSEPKDYSKWDYLIKSLTNHLIQRYGIAEVRSWIFTFWNEPFNPLPFTFSNIHTMFQLYKHTYNAIKSCDKKLVIGNPSVVITNFYHSEWETFIDLCNTNVCIPDVLIIHYYPVVNTGNFEFGVNLELSENPNYMADSLNNFKKQLNEPYSLKPTYITEWNMTPSHRELLNDTCFPAVYLVKNILENYDKVDSFGYWCLTDLLEELPQLAELFHGGLGLFTKNKIKKPSYYALSFLSHLKDHLIANGDSYFITKDDFGTTSIILYNYQHFSNLYAQGIQFDVTFINRYNTFINSEQKEISFKFQDMDNGNFIITEQIVNRNHGSCFDKWVEMGFVPLENEYETEILKGLSMPKLLKKNISIDNNELNYSCTLEPLEIRLIEIKKL